MNQKKCARCGQIRGIDYYYQDKKRRYNICRDCQMVLFENKSPID